MSEVVRYQVCGIDGFIASDAEGEYVLYEDYKKLQDQLAAANELNQDLINTIEVMERNVAPPEVET